MQKKSVGYIRVSSEEQARTGISLEMQTAKLRAYCVLNDLELVEIIEDAGVSAKTIKGRPGFQRALTLLDSDKADSLVIWKLDRAFRSTQDALRVAERLNKRGKALVSICEQLDTTSAVGEFFFTLMASLAQMERRLVGERVRAVFEQKRQKNEFCGGHAPYGYRSEAGALIPVAEEQKVLKKIRNLRKKGYSIRRITRCLAEEGCLNRRGRPFGKTQVERILRSDERAQESRSYR